MHASDDKHFYRPTFMAFHPNGTFCVSDGYANRRVVKFNRDGTYLTSWGEKGENGNETRAGYFNSVHGVSLDPQTNEVYVNDRVMKSYLHTPRPKDTSPSQIRTGRRKPQ